MEDRGMKRMYRIITAIISTLGPGVKGFEENRDTDLAYVGTGPCRRGTKESQRDSV